jgi:hypothetical protein
MSDALDRVAGWVREHQVLTVGRQLTAEQTAAFRAEWLAHSLRPFGQCAPENAPRPPRRFDFTPPNDRLDRVTLADGPTIGVKG